MSILVHGQKVVRFDELIINFFHKIESQNLKTIMKFFTSLGSIPSILSLSVIILLIFYIVFKIRSELLLFLGVIAGANLLFYTLKQMFARARPDLNQLIEVGGYSFPSGHSTNAVAFYGILSFILWRHVRTKSGRTIVVISSISTILMIGLSRIYLGVHYPSDVIGGFLVGGLWLTITIWLYQYYKERKYEKRYSKTKNNIKT
ncbi:phosphatase PAP2 family protein [Paenisporosarcina sp. TG20]|uniref:phosphatase PAP2 family protein n=1 Tax=Paenisporosarcina sp. TG20 TaxID=1211706 RepID=UPI001ED8C677|nr:phosphatase PAP2 family protein [Paenisporosarcina sp. TG20]